MQECRLLQLLAVATVGLIALLRKDKDFILQEHQSHTIMTQATVHLYAHSLVQKMYF